MLPSECEIRQSKGPQDCISVSTEKDMSGIFVHLEDDLPCPGKSNVVISYPFLCSSRAIW